MVLHIFGIFLHLPLFLHRKIYSGKSFPFRLLPIDKIKQMFYNESTIQMEGAREVKRDDLISELLKILERASLRELRGLIEFARSYIK